MDNHNRRKVLKADLEAGHGLAGKEWLGLARHGSEWRGRQGRLGEERTGLEGRGLAWIGRHGGAGRGKDRHG